MTDFIVSLQIMAKQIFIKFVSALVCMWYCVSIIGFDIHTCRNAEKSYVLSVMQSYSCVDIHPERLCEDDMEDCCAHVGQEVYEENPFSCCSDEYEVLDPLSVKTEDRFQKVSSMECLVCAYPLAEMICIQENRAPVSLPGEVFPFASGDDLLVSYGIFRI